MAITSLYFFLPGFIANMMPVLVRRIDLLNYPVDFGAKIRGVRLFGDHKTFRGFFFGILSGIKIAYIQKLLFLKYEFFRSISLLDYSAESATLIGFLLGFGVLFGDLVKSFFKRRVGIKPGRSWMPFDQLDFLIGGLLLVSVVYLPPFKSMIFILVTGFFMHIISNHLGFYLRIKKSRW